MVEIHDRRRPERTQHMEEAQEKEEDQLFSYT